MQRTYAEGRLRILLMLWLALFGGGVIVLGALTWTSSGLQLFTDTPTFVLAWIGQALLFLCSFYFFSGLRDNELCAPVLAWYKLVSGTVMVILFLRNTAADNALAVLGGGLLDYVMGFLTFSFWLGARRSRTLRMPLYFDIDPTMDQEPGGRGADALRLGLGAAAALFTVTFLALLALSLTSSPAESAYFKITAGNAVAVYAALAFLTVLAAETPERRIYTRDLVILGSFFATFALLMWTIRVPLSSTAAGVSIIGAVVHLTIGIALIALGLYAGRDQRPSRYFGPWLHRVFESFAQVVIKGGVEVLTPRQVTDRADDLLAKTPSTRKGGFKLALALIELGGLLQFRTTFSRMGRLEREEYLTSVFHEARGPIRDLIRVKQIVFLVYYSHPDAYESIGFVDIEDRERFKKAKDEGKLPAGPVVYPSPVTDSTLETDVCVIGSGAGGSVVAARLAEAGKRVVIIEEGPFLKRDRVNQDELDMSVQAYREGGVETSLDLDMYILQGRCVGGSTFLNNGICFDAPPAVLKEWAELGAPLDRDKLNQSFQRVRGEIGIIDLAEHPNLPEKGSFKFMEGCRALGLPAGWFEVNLDGCIGCGYCTTGCAYDKKMSMDRSYIPRALDAGALLVSECKALTVGVEGGRAKAVYCQRADGSPLTVKAKQIVVACGAIGSSRLLLRSGITHNVGTRLSFNVGSWVFAEFPEPIDSFDGVQMCAYAERPGYTLETMAMPPGVFAASMPGWFQDHFYNMQRYRHFAIAGVLVGTQAVGRVRPSRLPVLRDLLPPVRFTLPVGDLRKLKDGIGQTARVWLKAGASRVMPATFRPLALTHVSQVYGLDEYIVEPEDVHFGSAHPQGGNPMSDDRTLGAVNTRFQVHGLDNLFVCDASVFPSSVKVNPQLTIMAMADYASSIIAGM